MKRFIGSIVFAVSTAALFAAPPTSGDYSLSLKPRNWYPLGNYTLSTAPDGSLTFAFPHDQLTANYLYSTVKLPSKLNPKSISVSLVITTVGTPTWNYMFEPENVCDTPATVRPWVLAHNDWSGESGRWWSNPISYQLAAGSTTMTIPVSPSQWSNVNGHFGDFDATTTAAFYDAFLHLTSVGVTFGGGCFFGHGVSVSNGDANFYLTNYTIHQ
jgi:hypothetical protein